MASNETEVAELRNEVQALKEKLREEKQRNIRLEQYTRKENLRLLNVPEREDEDTEELFIDVLKEIGVYHENVRFHNVHFQFHCSSTGDCDAFIYLEGIGRG